jgi:hypothetical protein
MYLIAFVLGLPLMAQDAPEYSRPIQHPALLAGLWQVESPETAKPFAKELCIEIFTVWRDGLEYVNDVHVRFDGGWFSAQPSGIVELSGERLKIQLVREAQGKLAALAVNVDLVFDSANQSWSGVFQKNSVSRDVRLIRSIPTTKRSPVIGEWKSSNPAPGLDGNPGCIHFVEAWSDDLSTSEVHAWIDADGYFTQMYGEPVAVREVTEDRVQLWANANAAFGKSYFYTGSLSHSGTRLRGQWAPGFAFPSDFIGPNSSECLASIRPIRSTK